MVDPEDLKTEHLVEINAFVGEYSFRIAEVPEVEIRVKIWQTDISYGGDRFTYTISHHVHTPTQIDVYYPSAPFASTEEGAIQRAIRDTLTFYTGAIQQGHKPSAKWFIPDEDFR